MSEGATSTETAEPQQHEVEGVAVAGQGPGAAKLQGGSWIFRPTVELPFFLMFFIFSLTGAVINNMLLERTCLHILGYNESICAELISNNRSDSLQHLEEEVQSVTTMVTMARSMLEALFPAALSMFLGVWSNTHGRKPLIVWPLLGFAFSSILVCLYSLSKSVSPWWYVATSLPLSLGGGTSTLFTGAFCYLSDVTSEDNRSFRIALVEALLMGGMILGSLASPYAVLALGTPYLLLLSACLAVVGYVYANLWIEESIREPLEGGLRSVFDTSYVRDVLHTCFKQRPNFAREVTLLLVVANSVSIFVLYGLVDVDYLYVRHKLAWGLEEYSVFSAVNMVVVLAGLMLGVTVLQRMCRLSDVMMTMVAFLSSMTNMLGRALATKATSWIMYAGASVSLLRGLSSPLIRSLISKRESPQDVVKVFTLMAALEAVLPVLSPLVYSMLYKYTLTTLPSAVYILTFAIFGACLSMTCVAQYFMVKYPVLQYSELDT